MKQNSTNTIIADYEEFGLDLDLFPAEYIISPTGCGDRANFTVNL
jgi:hypothetical protein